MPIFEYKCSDCDNKFEELSMSSDETVNCPECNSGRVEKLLSTFAASTNSQSYQAPCGAASCGSGFS